MRLPVAALNGRLEFGCAFNIYHVPIDNNVCASSRTKCCRTLFCWALSSNYDDDKNEISASCAFLCKKIPFHNYPPSIGIKSDAQKQPCVRDRKYVIEKKKTCCRRRRFDQISPNYHHSDLWFVNVNVCALPMCTSYLQTDDTNWMSLLQSIALLSIALSPFCSRHVVHSNRCPSDELCFLFWFDFEP